ncbi:MAG: HEPN domain-containing protein [Candidatus Methanoperedens sp.]|nr:HEPN domain-containing protein [Candidatus Methanoperedens sp.]
MRKETENWWKQANRDLGSAKRIMELGEYHVCAFLSQQAVEKALKALLIDRTGNFPRIHDVVELSRRVKAPSKITELCAPINPAYTSTRYPDVASDFDKVEVEEIVISAEEILEWIKKELKL